MRHYETRDIRGKIKKKEEETFEEKTYNTEYERGFLNDTRRDSIELKKILENFKLIECKSCELGVVCYINKKKFTKYDGEIIVECKKVKKTKKINNHSYNFVESFFFLDSVQYYAQSFENFLNENKSIIIENYKKIICAKCALKLKCLHENETEQKAFFNCRRALALEKQER